MGLCPSCVMPYLVLCCIKVIRKEQKDTFAPFAPLAKGKAKVQGGVIFIFSNTTFILTKF
jgi:hypothetical protein